MEPAERIGKAFQFAQETTKQFITLATAIVAFTVTFLKEIAGVDAGRAVYVVEVAWFFYLASILFGMVTLMALAGNLERGPGTPSIYRRNVAVPSILQVATFFVATVLTVVFGVAAA